MEYQREWLEKDYYALLGVPQTATAKEITKAYRKLARELHPDANPDNPSAEDRFKEVSAAYDVLGDAEKRAKYDELRRLGPMAFGGGGGAGGFDFQAADLGDLGGIFGNLFGGMRPGRTRGSGGPQRGNDLEAELHLSFRDAVLGRTTAVTLTTDASCTTCNGSGARPGSSSKRCEMCAGRGVVDDNQGYFAFSQPCPACAGLGSIVTDPCGDCRGTGVQRRNRDVKIRVPAGVDDGGTIRLKGQGGAGRNGGPAGDLFVKVHVAPDEVFGRRGRDLTVSLPVTFSEAALGADIRAPVLEGDPVTIRIPPGTQSGRTFRVRSRGVHTPKGIGNLLVTVHVSVPTALTDEQRAAIEAFAATMEGSPRAHLEGVGQ